MKLRNKITGEVFNFAIKAETDPTESHFKLRTGSGGWEDGLMYDSLEELNEEWEDYEEPKSEDKYYYINEEADVCLEYTKYSKCGDEQMQIGNYFDTKEEAEKAVEKLKAWKRLKDKSFKLINYSCPLRKLYFEVDGGKFFEASGEVSEETRKDLTLLFGGED